MRVCVHCLSFERMYLQSQHILAVRVREYVRTIPFLRVSSCGIEMCLHTSQYMRLQYYPIYNSYAEMLEH